MEDRSALSNRMCWPISAVGSTSIETIASRFRMSPPITSPDTTGIPISFLGTDSLGAIVLYFNYDDSKLTYRGIDTYVEDEVFEGGVVGDWITVQWFDEPGTHSSSENDFPVAFLGGTSVL